MKSDPSRRSVLALGWVSFLTDVSSEMIYPLLPGFLTRSLGAGPAAIGLIGGIAEATASLAKIGSGVWSDRVRRRKPLVLLGYGIATAVRPLVAFARVWTQVLAIRFADRLGKGIRTSPRDALLADIVPADRRGRAFGFQRAMDNAGALVGPLLAAAIVLGWIVYALSYAGFAFLSGPLAIWGLFALYALFFGLTEGSERAFVADLVPVDLRGRAYGAFYAAVGIAALPASVAFGILWKRFGPRIAFLTGAAVALAAAIALWGISANIRSTRPTREVSPPGTVTPC